MFLDTSNKSLELLLGSAQTSAAMPIVVDYTDVVGEHAAPGSSIDSQSNGTTVVTIVSSPSSSLNNQTRKINSINVYNADTAAKLVTIRLNNNGALRPLVSCTLQVGDTLGYTNGDGWHVQDAQGNLKTGAANMSALAAPSGSSLVGFQQSGTGAVATTVQNVLMEVVSAYRFMTAAQISDVEARTRLQDVTAPLQAALNTGKLVFCPDGDYLISSALTKTSNFGGLVGNGFNTLIITNSSTADVFTLGDGTNPFIGALFADFRIWSTVNKTAGSLINGRFLSLCTFRNVRAGSQYDQGISGSWYPFTGYTINGFNNCAILGGEIGANTIGISIQGNGTYNSELTLDNQLRILGPSNTTSKGIYIGGSAGGVYLRRVDVGRWGYGLYLDMALTSVQNREIFLENHLTIDGNFNWGINIEDGGAATLQATGIWLSGNGGAGSGGLRVGIQSTVTTSAHIVGGIIQNSYEDGAQINYGTWLFSGVQFVNNGHGAVAGGHALWFSGANVATVNVGNCHFISNGNGTKGYGLLLPPNSSSSINMTDNNFVGNGQGTIFDPSTSTTKTITNNTGYNPLPANVLTVGASPYTFTNNTGQPLYVFVEGGTVSAIAVQGKAVASATNGAFVVPMNRNIAITYTGLPVVTTLGI